MQRPAAASKALKNFAQRLLIISKFIVISINTTMKEILHILTILLVTLTAAILSPECNSAHTFQELVLVEFPITLIDERWAELSTLSAVPHAVDTSGIFFRSNFPRRQLTYNLFQVEFRK